MEDRCAERGVAQSMCVAAQPKISEEIHVFTLYTATNPVACLTNPQKNEFVGFLDVWWTVRYRTKV